MNHNATSVVENAVKTLARGQFVVVTDSVDRENEGDLVCAAELVTVEQMAFIVRHTTGIVCAPMSGARADELDLPQMVEDNSDPHGTAFTVTVDLREVGTGVSAEDRTRTVRALASTSTKPTDFNRPGHIFPLRAQRGGVLTRAGHTEAAVDLTTMAGLSGVAVIGEIVDEDGSMRRGDSLQRFAAAHGIPVVSIDQLIEHRRRGNGVELVSTARMPTEFGDFHALAYRAMDDRTEHLALVMGDIAAAGRTARGVLVRVHSECLTGDIVGSLRCDCGTQLEQSFRAIAQEGVGAIVYLRGHEGRGIGLGLKIRAYDLQDAGLDTVDANTAQGLPVDARDYSTATKIIESLNMKRLRLITNNPDKLSSIGGNDVEVVSRVVLPSSQNRHNRRYLRTKRTRLDHDLYVEDVEQPGVLPA